MSPPNPRHLEVVEEPVINGVIRAYNNRRINNEAMDYNFVVHCSNRIYSEFVYDSGRASESALSQLWYVSIRRHERRIAVSLSRNSVDKEKTMNAKECTGKHK